MSSVSPTNYGSLQPSSSSSAAASTGAYFSRARVTTHPFFATRRPWRELFNFSSFRLPAPPSAAAARAKRNLAYFRVNYTMVLLLVLFLSLLWHPISMIVFILVFIAWFFLYFFRDGPLPILGRSVDDRIVLGVLGVLTIVALVLTHVWLNVVVSLLIGALLVGLHAILRETEDLYYVDEEIGEGGLFSVVGSPRGSGYPRI